VHGSLVLARADLPALDASPLTASPPLLAAMAAPQYGCYEGVSSCPKIKANHTGTTPDLAYMLQTKDPIHNMMVGCNNSTTL
jgi:hypothetical protein